MFHSLTRASAIAFLGTLSAALGRTMNALRRRDGKANGLGDQVPYNSVLR
jgi:hypothetical protein